MGLKAVGAWPSRLPIFKSGTFLHLNGILCKNEKCSSGTNKVFWTSFHKFADPPLLLPQNPIPKKPKTLFIIDQLTERQQTGTGQTCLGCLFLSQARHFITLQRRPTQKLLFTLCHDQKRLKKRPILLPMTFRSGRRENSGLIIWAGATPATYEALKPRQLNYDSFMSATALGERGR